MNTGFGQRSPKILNEIPATIEASATVATFKSGLKSHFLSQMASHPFQSSRPAPPIKQFLDTVRVINSKIITTIVVVVVGLL